jgi:hypothetical protein
MTHGELAKALKLSRPTISRDVKKGMPLSIEGAKEWRDEHKEFKGEKTGPKPKIEYDEPVPQLPNRLRRERQEYQIAKRLALMDASEGAKLNELRQEYDKVARLVQADYLDRIDCALNRRLLSTYGDPDDCFESFVKALVELADHWQNVLDTEYDESKDAAAKPASREKGPTVLRVDRAG